MTARPKTEYVRNRALLDACGALPCQHCSADDKTIVPAHSNWSDLGHKGKSIKADDRFVAALCHRCHTMLDQGSKLSRDQRRRLWLDAHLRTVKVLLRRGLWPRGVDLPNTVTD